MNAVARPLLAPAPPTLAEIIGAPDPVDLDALDPGVRRLVAFLRSKGYSTTDSGDGVSKTEAIAEGEALDVPHVFIRVTPSTMVSEALYLQADLAAVGVEVYGKPGVIEATYDPADGIALLAVYGVSDADLPAALPG